MLSVVIFDDVVAARGETFKIPGLTVDVHGHADDAVALCTSHPYAVVFMDFAMGADHDDGSEAVTKLRAAGFKGRIVATSSDPARNAEMKAAGADEALDRKTYLRSYLLHLGSKHLHDEQRQSGPEDPA